MIAEGKIKWPRVVALQVAREILGWLKPFCAKVVVAGSLRRRRGEVGDVELLYIARFVPWPDPGDIFQTEVPTNVADHALKLQRDAGVLAGRLNREGAPIGWGPSNKYAVHVGTGMAVDLFQATPETWWNNLVCRTGGAQSNKAIAGAAQGRGWIWNSTGEGFTRLSGPDAGRVHRVTSEREAFGFVGLPYLLPEERK